MDDRVALKVRAAAVETWDVALPALQLSGLGSDEDLEGQLAGYEAVVESLHEGLVIQDLDLRIVTANQRAGEVLGMSLDQMLGRTSTDPTWRAMHADGTPWPGEDHPSARVRRSGRAELDHLMGVVAGRQEARWLRVNSTPLRDRAGALTGVATTFVDETAALHARDELQRAKELFATAFADAPVGMALVGLDGAWLQVNRSLLEITGYAEDQLLARTFQDITHSDDLDADLELLGQLLRGELAHYTMEKRYLTASGGVVWVSLSVSLVRRPDGAPEHLVAHVVDITERRRLQEALQRLADHDALTGLWNRRRFEEELRRQGDRCRRYGEQASLLVLDLDGFKQVNDTLGHQAGDDLLRTVARAMGARLRGSDAIARFGGDEFAVLLPGVAGPQAETVARDLAAAVREAAEPVAARGPRVSASVGAATMQGERADGAEALLVADAAMYRAKASASGGLHRASS